MGILDSAFRSIGLLVRECSRNSRGTFGARFDKYAGCNYNICIQPFPSSRYDPSRVQRFLLRKLPGMRLDFKKNATRPCHVQASPSHPAI